MVIDVGVPAQQSGIEKAQAVLRAKREAGETDRVCAVCVWVGKRGALSLPR